MSNCFFLAALYSMLFCIGCGSQNNVPIYPHPAALDIVLVPEIDTGVSKETKIEARPEDVTHLYTLIKPTRRVQGRIDKSIDHLVAYVILTYPDNSRIRLVVRSTGKNPLAVSSDDEIYYYADEGVLSEETSSDGAVDLLRFLKKRYPRSFRR